MDWMRALILSAAVTAPAAHSAQGPPSSPAAAPVGPSPQASPAAGPADLSGRWRFNAGQSDDAKQKMRDAMQSRHVGGSGTSGGGSWGGRHRGGGGRGSGPAEGGGRGGPKAETQDTLRGLLEAPVELRITQTEKEIAVLEKEDGRLRALHPDGQKYKVDSVGTEVKTRWDKDRLVVETQREQGPKSSETLSLAPDRKQLWIDIRLEVRSTDPVTFRRVYDAAATE